MTSQAKTAAILCDVHGVIVRVTHDALGLAERCAPGTAFLELVDHASVGKAGDFINAIRRDGGAFDWQLCLQVNDKITLLYGAGFADQQQLWIVMAATPAGARQVLQEINLLPRAQAALLRAALKYAGALAPATPDEAQFEELTRLNNDMGRVQRELAHRNAELETLRTTLEAQRAQLLAANARLDALAATDGLTGVANRRAFQARLEAESLRAARYPAPLALLMADIDHFKKLNDAFGHQAGDEVLKTMGQLLAVHFRKTDFVARYGGEEFAVILINTEASAAADVAERFRQRVEATPWPQRAVTVSIGIACHGPGAADAAQLLRCADKALYFSKEHGRNRITHFVDTVLPAQPVIP